MVKGDWQAVLYTTSLPWSQAPLLSTGSNQFPQTPAARSTALMINGLQTDQPAERALLSLQQHGHCKRCTGNLHSRQARDSERWDLLLNKQKPSWGMCPTSARWTKEELGVGLSLCGAGQPAARTKNQALHPTGLKCCFPYLEEGMEKKIKISR